MCSTSLYRQLGDFRKSRKNNTYQSRRIFVIIWLWKWEYFNVNLKESRNRWILQSSLQEAREGTQFTNPSLSSNENKRDRSFFKITIPSLKLFPSISVSVEARSFCTPYATTSWTRDVFNRKPVSFTITLEHML